MISNFKKDEVNRFVKSFFKTLDIKHFFITIIIGIIFLYVIKDYDKLIPFPITIVIGSTIKHFVFPNFLYRETDKYIKKYFGTIEEKDEENKEILFFICNIKKWDGPMFGVLEVSIRYIKFTPFKSNLYKEKFSIDIKENKINDISSINIRGALIENLFSKELSKALKISYDNSKVLIQLPNLEFSTNLIKEKLNYKKHTT